jgi:hypothetical protein
VLLELVCVVLGSREGETRRDDTFDTAMSQPTAHVHAYQDSRRVVCQVQEQSDALHATVLFEIPGKEAARFQVDTHGTENDGEVVIVVIVYTLRRLPDQTSLSANLSGDFVVGETGSGEDRDLLTAGDGVHGVDG